VVDAASRARVERLLKGDFRPDDLTSLFLYARDRCDGREPVQEVGDFVAHHDERTKGLVTRETRDWFITSRVTISGIASPFQASQLPPNFREFLSASLRRMGPSIKQYATSLSVASRMLPGVLKKFVVKPDGTLAIPSNLPANERKLIEILATRLVVRPAFTSDRLFNDLSETLRSNGLLHRNELHRFKELKPVIALFAVSVMHNSDVNVGDGRKCKLKAAADGVGETMHVQASVPTIANPNLRVASSIYSTDLKSEEHCDQLLLTSPKPWDFDIEVGPNQKLVKLG
jgi:hypothetical protein